jgi:hypothetical protein
VQKYQYNTNLSESAAKLAPAWLLTTAIHHTASAVAARALHKQSNKSCLMCVAKLAQCAAAVMTCNRAIVTSKLYICNTLLPCKGADHACQPEPADHCCFAAAVIDHFTAVSTRILPGGCIDTTDAKTLITHVYVQHHSKYGTFSSL